MLTIAVDRADVELAEEESAAEEEPESDVDDGVWLADAPVPTAAF